MKEFRRLKLDVIGEKLFIPYQIQFSPYSIISLEFNHNIVYEFELIKNPIYNEYQYKTKSKSYHKYVYLIKEIVDKYFMDKKEMHTEEFYNKMDKLLK